MVTVRAVGQEAGAAAKEAMVAGVDVGASVVGVGCKTRSPCTGR